MTSVTFPTNLGGSGQTISDDADPNTGLLNGGHRQRFVPALRGTVDMAQYVFQYADKIDNAADDADRAEDARAYVEGVEDVIKLNYFQHYLRQSSVNLDFQYGKYEEDDGDFRNSVNDFSLFTFSRNGEKYYQNKNGYIVISPADTPAREWVGGRPSGLKLEPVGTNLMFPSEDFSGYSGEAVVSPGGESIIEGSDWSKVDTSSSNLGDNSNIIIKTFEFTEGSWYTISMFVKPAEIGVASLRLPTVFGGTFQGASFNLNNGEVIETNGNPITEWTPLADGSCRISISAECTSTGTGQTRFYVGPLSRTQFDGVSGVYATGYQLEKDVINPTSYIPTTSSSASRTEDTFSKNLEDFYNPNGFTLYAEINNMQDVLGNFRRFIQLESNSTDARVSFQTREFGVRGLRVAVRDDEGSFVIQENFPFVREGMKVGFSWRARDGRACISVDGESFSSFAEGQEMSDMFLLNNSIVSQNKGSSNIGDAMYIPHALSESEIALLTRN